MTGGDIDNDGVLDVGETWTYQATGTAVAGNYSNIGTVKGSFTDSLGNTEIPTAADSSDYFGADPGIAINKVTNGADGLTILVGSAVTWTYAVTNTGNVALSNVAVTDDDLGTITSFTGDINNNSLLDLTETWTYTKTGTAIEGNYSNIGTVTGSFTDSLGNTETVSDSDHSSYFGDALPQFAVTKTASVSTIREDLGGDVTYTITIHNTDDPNSGDLDPIRITSLPDTLWFDHNGDGIQQASELQTVDHLADALADWQAAGNTGDIVLNPGEAFTFDYTVSFAGGNVLKPWTDPKNTIVVNAVDNEGNIGSAQDNAVVDVIQKNQLSIDIDSLTGTRNGGVVVGNFHISNASDDPVDVLVDSLNIVFEERISGSKGNKVSWAFTNENYSTDFWLDSNNNGVFDSGETYLGTSSNGEFVDTTIVFGSSVYIGYQSTFLDGSAPNPLRAKAEATIDGHFDKFGNKVEFQYSTTS